MNGPAHPSTFAPRPWGRAAWLPLALLLIPAPFSVAREIWELSPYRIAAVVAVGDSPRLGTRWEKDLHRALKERADSVIGTAWQLAIAPASPKLRQRIATALASITRDDLAELAEQYKEQFKQYGELDKLLLLGISDVPAGYHLAAREYDTRTRTWGTLTTATVRHPALLPSTAFSALRGAFSPLARIESADSHVAAVELKAGGLPPRDRSVRFLDLGDVLRPIYRRIDRQGNPLPQGGIDPIAWTYLTAATIDGAKARCLIQSGVRNPLLGRTRGRTERLALVVAPPTEPTRVRIVSRAEPQRALPGYDVYAAHPRHRALLLVRYGLLTEAQLQSLLDYRRRHADEMIGHAAVSRGLIDRGQLEAALPQRQREEPVGALLVRLGLLTEKDLAPLERNTRREPDLEVVHLAVSRGLLTPADLETVRTRQKATAPLGRSDYRGRLTVVPGGYPLQVLYVKHGGELLARLPVVAGMVATLDAPIPDDDARLEAEGFVTALQENLVDMIVRRETLVARFRSRLQSRQLEEARQHLEVLTALRAEMEEFQAALIERQKSSTVGAGEPWIKERINKSYEDTKALIAKYLDQSLLDTLRRQWIDAESSS